MAADLSNLPQAKASLVGSGEGRSTEAVGSHTFDAHLLSQLADGGLCAPDAEGLSCDAREHPATLCGRAHLTPFLEPFAGSRGQGGMAGMRPLDTLSRDCLAVSVVCICFYLLAAP